MQSTITDAGSKSVLTMRFSAEPLIGRQPLDTIIDHIRNHVDLLVSQLTK